MNGSSLSKAGIALVGSIAASVLMPAVALFLDPAWAALLLAPLSAGLAVFALYNLHRLRAAIRRARHVCHA
ncbi:MAG: hypothetical protein K2Q10_03250, partial [Rhodospirillales bacterium]|nr:hypothetical protein [Rhodospirillales bacterium]